MHDAQMEMSFGSTGRLVSRRQRRLARGQWWFQRMRQIVDRAIEWQPAAAPRPEQIWFAGAHRQPAFQPSSPTDSRRFDKR